MDLRVGARGALVAVAVSLVALALPLTSMSANASEARVVVAGLTPVPTTDTVVRRAITTSFDLALTQRHGAALRAYITSLSKRVRRTITTTSPPRSTRPATARRPRRWPSFGPTSADTAFT